MLPFLQGWWQSIILYIVQEDDCDLQKTRKTTILRVFVPLLPIITIGIARAHDRYSLVINSIGMLSCVAGALTLWMRWDITETFINTQTVLCSVCFMLYDYSNNVQMENAMWPFFVLLMDFLLVMRTRNGTDTKVFICIMIYISIDTLETILRFGLYDIDPSLKPNLAPYKCNNPPCPEGVSSGLLKAGSKVLVFVIDWICTRRFATALYTEKENMDRAIDVAEKVSTALAVFNLHAAEEHLNSAHGIPEGLFSALRSILLNLESYRPYLPQSCLSLDTFDDSENGSSSQNSVEASVQNPSPHDSFASEHCGKKHVSLLLTNIRRSGALFIDGDNPFGFFSKLLANVVSVSNSKRGVLEFIICDKLCVSFNAAHCCTDYAPSAAKAALKILWMHNSDEVTCDHAMNIGIASGVMRCCTIGNADVKRFVMFGSTHSDVHRIERIGALFGHSIVLDVATEQKVFSFCETRVLLTAIHIGSEPPCVLYELIYDSGEPESTLNISAPNEWMYELEKKKQPPWQVYNTFALRYLHQKDTPYEALEKMVDPRPETAHLMHLIVNKVTPRSLKLYW